MPFSEELVPAHGNAAQDGDDMIHCGILGGKCLTPEASSRLASSGHKCPGCECPVHNLCHERLRASDDRGDYGMMCGGDACKSTMTEAEKIAQIKIRDAQDSASSSPSAAAAAVEDLSAAETTCGAGDHCIASSDSDAALTVNCPHGLPRHFACARAPCPELCGEGGASQGGKSGRQFLCR